MDGLLAGLSLTRAHRVTYVDRIRPLMEEAAQRRRRVVYLGSRPQTTGRGIEVLKRRHAELEMFGLSGYFDTEAGGPDNGSSRRSSDGRLRFLPVGMGMPRQEHWILDNLDRLPGCVIVTAGAAIEYVGGAIPTPPRWAARWSLEWLFRLAAEPKRLWHRYLVEPWLVLWALFVDCLRTRGASWRDRGRRQ